MKFIISAGYKYTDIDVLASSLALKELIDIQGKNAAVHLTGPFNATIPTNFNYWDVDVINRVAPRKSKENKFLLVDISNPDHVESFVEIDNVSAVYDHHYGYEEFWNNRLGNKAKIESIGACATLIWEEFRAENTFHKISPSSANLLYTAIISNTLNFKAQISSVRDEQAASELSSFITLPKDWIHKYYREVESTLFQDLDDLIKKDTKILTLFNVEFYFSQIELWNANALMSQYDFLKKMSEIFPRNLWLLSLISIEENCNYLFTNSGIIEKSLEKILFAKKTVNHLKTEALWMRKEIIKLGSITT